MPDGFSVDAKDLTEMAAKLKRAAIEGRAETNRALVSVGEAHKIAARAELDGHSVSIPPTIRMEPLPGANAVRLTAAGTALAWVYEKGNKDNRRGKTFKHPIFGRTDIPEVEQPRYPFFSRARSKLRRWTTSTLTEGWRRGMRKAGLKVE